MQHHHLKIMFSFSILYSSKNSQESGLFSCSIRVVFFFYFCSTVDCELLLYLSHFICFVNKKRNWSFVFIFHNIKKKKSRKFWLIEWFNKRSAIVLFTVSPSLTRTGLNLDWTLHVTQVTHSPSQRPEKESHSLHSPTNFLTHFLSVSPSRYRPALPRLASHIWQNYTFTLL